MTTGKQEKTPKDLLNEHVALVDSLFHKSRPLIPGSINDKTAWNLCDLCVRYGLDPVSGDVAWLSGGVPYVTFRGMTRIAHNTGLFQGVTVDVIHMDNESGHYLVKAMVYKAGCEYPFEDIGDSETSNKQVGKMGKIKIATTRAKCRALRSAFPVALPVDGDSEEEMKDLFERAGVTAHQPAQTKAHATNKPPEHSSQNGINGQASQSHKPNQPGEATAQKKQNTTTNQSTASSPPDDGPNTPAWREAKKELGLLMNEYQLTGASVKEASTQLHGRGASSELNAREIRSLIFVLREESGQGGRPTGPKPPENRIQERTG